MEDKTNLFVFSKKEVFLIFLFMVLIGIFSFILGVKAGKSFTYSEEGFTQEDRNTVQMYSREEEKVEQLSQKGNDAQGTAEMENAEGEKGKVEGKGKVYNETYKMLQEEVNKLDKTQVKGSEKKKAKVDDTPDTEPEISEAESKDPKRAYRGKHTIQLGSHQTLREAEKFADGFRIRGYNPIIHEVELKGRGTWYRVSLGVFDSISEAKEYILQEKSLFQNQDYVIGRF